MAHVGEELRFEPQRRQRLVARTRQFMLGLLARRDVGADGDVLIGPPLRVHVWDHGSIGPIITALLLAVLHLTVPHLARLDSLPHFVKETFRVTTAIEYMRELADQFFGLKLADLAEFFVDMGNTPSGVGDARDAVFI